MLISLGSNAPGGQSAAAGFVLYGRDRIIEIFGKQGLRFSGLYTSAAFPAGIGPDFVNAALHLTTSESPRSVLTKLHTIEAEADRKRDIRWGQRTLDLDLLAYDYHVLPNITTQSHWRDLAPELQRTRAPDQLVLPHPRLQDRAFVLVPLAEIAPDWIHPVTGQSVMAMRDALPVEELAGVVPYGQ